MKPWARSGPNLKQALERWRPGFLPGQKLSLFTSSGTRPLMEHQRQASPGRRAHLISPSQRRRLVRELEALERKLTGQ